MTALKEPKVENNILLVGDEEKGLQRVEDHRKLAIISTICGLSCIGIVSLIYSVKTREINKRIAREEKVDPQIPKLYSQKARYWGTASLLACVGLLIIIPLLMGLLSYLLTFIN